MAAAMKTIFRDREDWRTQLDGILLFGFIGIVATIFGGFAALILIVLLQLSQVCTISWHLFYACTAAGSLLIIVYALRDKYGTLKWYNFIDPLYQARYYRFVFTRERAESGAWHNEITGWCHESARGRRRIFGCLVMFARKSDAAMFALYSGTSAELPCKPGRKTK